MNRALLVLVVLTLLGGCTTTPLSVDPTSAKAVYANAAALLPSTQASTSNSKATGTSKLSASGNLGISRTYSYVLNSAPYDSGLLLDTISAERGTSGGGATTVTKEVSLCGLATLASEVETEGRPGTIALIPSARGTNPIAVGFSPSASSRLIVSAFNSKSTSICEPSPESVISYTLIGKFEWATPGPLGTLRTVFDFQDETSCSISPLPPELKHLAALGATLSAKCTHKSHHERPKESIFVYMPNAKRYFPVYRLYSTRTQEFIDYSNISHFSN